MPTLICQEALLNTSVAGRQYAGSSLRAYESLEAAARKAGRGLWAGSFVPPWEWRKNSLWT